MLNVDCKIIHIEILLYLANETATKAQLLSNIFFKAIPKQLINLIMSISRFFLFYFSFILLSSLNNFKNLSYFVF